MFYVFFFLGKINFETSFPGINLSLLTYSTIVFFAEKSLLRHQMQFYLSMWFLGFNMRLTFFCSSTSRLIL